MKKKVITSCLSLTLLCSALAYAFTDTNGHWAKQYIEFANENGIVTGFQDGSYKPENRVTRAEFATMITQYNQGNKTDANFPDVVPSDWFNGFVGYVTANKIMNGYPDGFFRPNNPITRAEAAATLKSMLYPGETESSNRFSDALPDWAINAINVTAKHGIFSGDTQNRFRPNDYLTRAEAAVILAKMKGFVAKEEPKPVFNKFEFMPLEDQLELDAILKQLGADDNYLVSVRKYNCYASNDPNDWYYFEDYYVYLTNYQQIVGINYAPSPPETYTHDIDQGSKYYIANSEYGFYGSEGFGMYFGEAFNDPAYSESPSSKQEFIDTMHDRWEKQCTDKQFSH